MSKNITAAIPFKSMRAEERHPSEIFEEMGIKQIWPPKTFTDRFWDGNSPHWEPGDAQSGRRLLCAIVYNGAPNDYLKAIVCQYDLDSVRRGYYAASYYILTSNQHAELRKHTGGF